MRAFRSILAFWTRASPNGENLPFKEKDDAPLGDTSCPARLHDASVSSARDPREKGQEFDFGSGLTRDKSFDKALKNMDIDVFCVKRLRS